MMEQKDRRRSTGKVDRLPPELKDTVEQMLLTGCTYKEIVAFLKENGEEMSQMAICTYAKKYLATVEMINVAQSNFSMLMVDNTLPLFIMKLPARSCLFSVSLLIP